MLGRRQGASASSSPAHGNNGAAPRASTAATSISINTGFSPKTVFQRLGIIKPPQLDLNTQQQRELDLLEKEQNDMDVREAQIKARMMVAMRANSSATLVRERAELSQIKLDRAKNDEYIRAMVTQKSHIERRRKDARVMTSLSRGNEALKAETKAAQDAFDIADITGDFDDLVNEGIEDQVDILEGFSNVDTTSRLNDVTIQTANGSVSMGDDIDSEVAQMRQTLAQESALQELEVRESLLPVMAGGMPQQRQRPQLDQDAPLFSGRTALTTSGQQANSRAAAATSSSRPAAPTRAPFVASTSHPTNHPTNTFDADLEWLQ